MIVVCLSAGALGLALVFVFVPDFLGAQAFGAMKPASFLPSEALYVPGYPWFGESLWMEFHHLKCLGNHS